MEVEQVHAITVAQEGTSFPCRSNQTLLEGMERARVDCVLIGCRRGGCGVCKVQILTGETSNLKMSRAHVSAEEEATGLVLACCVRPRSDITLRVV